MTGPVFPDDFRCPRCNEVSGMAIGPTQALCTNDAGNCNILFFNPSLPDGGLSDAQPLRVVDGDGFPL